MSPAVSRVNTSPSLASSDLTVPSALPPSPPLSPKPTSSRAVLRAQHHLRQLERGVIDRRDCTFYLSQQEFADLERRIEAVPRLQQYWTHKLRYDYDAGVLTLRMPDAIHEVFIKRVEAALQASLIATAERLEASDTNESATAAAAELRRVFLSGNTTLNLEGVESSSQDSDSTPAIIRRSPDASFCHPSSGTNAPPLVVEVSYSQQKKALGYMADSYIVDSRHAIRCVLGFDLGYGKKIGEQREASVSVWRAGVDGEGVGICRAVVEGELFREHGESVDGMLELTVADFLPPAVAAELSESALKEPITIGFADLAVFLTEAETTKAVPPAPVPSAGSTRFRKRKRTPSEELSDTREESFTRAEDDALAMRQKEDPEWVERDCGLQRKVSKRRARRKMDSNEDPAVAVAGAEVAISRR
ncbi:hypothetical protein B0A48_17837 [Cryoendolithus antarcticus]|uniref:Restriction endonuclease domain-containing protein n=1 Tax=Cryoendolithus antarcticus TaxID=1507870 RepID=A0A1V8SAU7_9PEZI|nr:hypothetical protein B0A48_17837 [Cryoendolithus antarcticus]